MRAQSFALALLLGTTVGCDDGGADPTPTPDLAAADATPTDLGAADAGPSAEVQALLSVPETLARALPGLQGPVHVVRTEGHVPHVFAANRLDLARVHGFLVAQDRFWMIDLGRRLATGTISALIGDLTLSTDIASRAQGLPEVADRLLAAMSAEQRAELEAFAQGINAYVTAAQAGELPVPSELEVAAPLLGAEPAALLEPFTARDVAAFAAVIIQQGTCARSEIARTQALEAALAAQADAPFEAERRAGVQADLYDRVQPADPVTTGGGAAKATPPAGRRQKGARLSFPPGLLPRALAGQAAWRRLAPKVLGSNAWAVAGDRAADGATLLAGDGHLALAVPAYFHQAGLDTQVLGGEPWHVRGNFIPGLPPLGVGTNGQVAWSFTCFYSDTVDHYREVVRLDADGWPDATRFDGAWQPLTATTEAYPTRSVPALGSAGGDVEVPRFALFDGRRLIAIEGEPAEPGAPGALDLGNGPVIPGDVDGDGEVVGLSLDATWLDAHDMLGAYTDLSRATDLDDFLAKHRRVALLGSHFVVADRGGRIAATGYHASPCRANLPRTEDGRRFAEGADPQRILDGTRFGGFALRFTATGEADEGDPNGPGCVVPWADFPKAVDPAAGFVVSANNDPSGLSLDGSLADDGIYVGGPFATGFRAARITERLAEVAAGGAATVADMAAIQADIKSATAARWLPFLLEALDRAADLQDGDGVLEGADARLAALAGPRLAELAEVGQRLRAWRDRGFEARSGVQTVYADPDADARQDAVATMLWNAWLGHFDDAVFGDEGIPAGVNRLSDTYTRSRTLHWLIAGRGAENPEGLASWHPEHGESVYFDRRDTPEHERSDEVAVQALLAALDFLASPPDGSEGGFGTADMDQWLWGLRHTVRFESILAPFVAGLDGLDLLLRRFGITPRALPLTDEALERGDPRQGLAGFPRGGDNHSVDNADNDYRPTRFEYRDGPVKRLVIALHPDGRVSGQNIIPGGQSGLMDSPFFADQVRRWLANEAWPLRFHLDEIVAGATGREVYRPE